VGPALEYGFGQALNEFLTSLGDGAPFSSLAEIVDYNNQDPTNRAPYGQGYLESSVNTSITSEEYNQIRESNQAQAKEELDALFENQEIDVIVSSVNQIYAPAGYPALTVPSGYDSITGEPQSVVFVGGFLSEPQLLAVGYAYEQATLARVSPDLTLEPWKSTPCTPCNPIEVCFLPDTCLLRDSTTGNWTGEAAGCNDFAPPCEECFPNSPCYFGNATTPGPTTNSTDTGIDTTTDGYSSNTTTTATDGSDSSSNEQHGSNTSSGSKCTLSKWGLYYVAGWMASSCMQAFFS